MSFFNSEIPVYTGELPPDKLPGTVKKSFVLPFAGGEIWFEHLDGMYQYTDLVREKLKGDIPIFRRPSNPSAIGFVLDETWITEELAEDIAESLCETAKVFRRVYFIGTDRRTRAMLRKALAGRSSFAIAFINNFERAKEWLVSEGE